MKQRKLFKKFTLSFIFILIFIVPITAYATYYSSTLKFKVAWKGKAREFTGNNITMQMHAHSDINNKASSKTFNVTLYRRNTFSDDRISTMKYPKNGFGHEIWYGVGKGKYYFFFSKANDGVTISSEDVEMFN